ncbi:hypothetical protein MHYP_G00070460 [Metynnis hypsauchen]
MQISNQHTASNSYTMNIHDFLGSSAESAANQESPLGLAVSRGMLPVFVSACQKPPGQSRLEGVSHLGGRPQEGVTGSRQEGDATRSDSEHCVTGTHTDKPT